jgi:hypothetical protein
MTTIKRIWTAIKSAAAKLFRAMGGGGNGEEK